VTFGLISLLAYGFSFGKSLVVARYFGTSAEMDAFTLAVLLPNLLATLLTGGFAISLVPALASAELKSQEERANTFRAGLLLFAAVACIAAVLLAILARPTMALVAPGFDGAKQILAAGLLRWCAALLPLNAVYAYCSAELLSRKKYIGVAAAPVITTAISVAALLLFPGIGVKVLALGLVVGTLLQALAVAAPTWGVNRLREALRWWTPDVRELARQQLPLLLISSFGVVNVSVDQFMAGLLPSGSAAALSFATNLNMVVNQVVVMAASWVLLPELSKLVAEGDTDGLALKARQSILGIALLAMPVAIVIFILGGPAVRLLFQHGRFDSSSTHRVSAIWMGYTCGLLPVAIAMIPVRLLNAMRQNQFLVRVGVAALAINAGLDYILMRWLGPVGISLSTSLVYLCTAILVFWFVKRLVPKIFVGKLWTGILRALLLCVPAGIGLLLFKQTFPGAIALFAGGTLFAGVVLCLYHWCGLVQIPFKKYRAVLAQ
jgi:putative peptidoglycan lipid II flippase